VVNKGLVRTTAFTDSGLIPGVQCTYEITAVDTLGNESAASARVNGAPSTMGAGESVPVGTNALAAGSYEENNGAIVYTGSWSRPWDGNASGSYYMYSGTEGSKAVVSFKGTGIKWNAARYSNYGTAEVWIDGNLDSVVSLYNATEERKQTVYQKMNLANGWHTMEIRVLENRQVNIDTLTVVETDDVTAPDAPGAVTITKGNTILNISWAANGESDLEGYRVYRSAKPDGNFVVVGQNALKLIKGAVQYTDKSLSNGFAYYYVVTAVDKYGNESAPSQVVSEIPAALDGKHQEDDEGFQFTGTWNRTWDGNADGSYYRYNNTTGNTATLVFYGTGIKWMALTGTNYGKAEVYIDDVLMGTVDLYRPQTSSQNIVWISSPPLSLGTHKITIRNTGTKNAASSGYYINIDSFEVLNSPDNKAPVIPKGLTSLYSTNENDLQWYTVDDSDLYGYYVYRSVTGQEDSFSRITLDPIRFGSTYMDTTISSPAYYRVTAIDNNGNESLPSIAVLSVPTAVSNVTVEENNPLISYNGVWNRISNSDASGGYWNYTSDKPVKIAYAFYGTGIDLISYTAASAGTILIKVDGGPEVKVDLYTPSEQTRKPVFRLRNLVLGLHTIEITDSGVNINSSGSAINIDAFRIVDADAGKPQIPDNISATVLVNKVKLMWSNTGDHDVIGYNVYYKYGALEFKKANLAGPVQSGYTHTGLNLASIYYYVVKAVDSLGNESDASIEVSAQTSESYIKALLQPSYSVEKGSSLTISAENSYSTDPPLAYYWDLDGDGQYDDAEGIEATLAFPGIGEYTIGLKVVDSLARMDTTTSKVIVTAPSDKLPPSAPSNLMVMTKTGSAVLLAWTASNDDIGVTEYEVYRDDVKIGTSPDTKFTDSNVVADTSYKYHVLAKDASGKASQISNTVFATPKMPDITNIEPISGSTIGGIATKTLKIFFADNGGVVGSHAAFEYSKDGKTWIAVNGTINGPLRVNDATLYYYCDFDLTDIDSGNYYIRYSLFDGSDNVDRVTAALTVDRTRPAAPPNLTADSETGKINLSWELTGDSDVMFYNVYGSSTENGTYKHLIKVTGMANTRYTDNDVAPGVTKYYKVTAVDRFEQESSFSNVASAAPVVDDISPVVLGIDPADGTVLGPDARIVVRAEDNLSLSKITLQYSLDGATWIDIATQFTENNATFNWSTSPVNGSVKVRAIAVDKTGNISDGTPLRIYNVDNQGPQKVTDLRGTPYTTSITLYWKYIMEQDFSYFQVERKDTPDGEYRSIGKVYTTLGINVTGLNDNTEYSFRVAAYDKLGNRGIPSDEIKVTTTTDTEAPRITSIGPSPAYFNNTILLYGSASDDVAVKYFTFQMSRDLNSWTDIATMENPNRSSAWSVNYSLDVSKMAEGPCYIRGVAKDEKGNTSSILAGNYVEYRIDHTAPSVPTGLKVVPSAGFITIEWSQGSEADLSAYRVFKSVAENGQFEIAVDKVSSTAYRDRDVEQGKTYYYKVCAIDAAGNIGYTTAAVSGSPSADEEAPTILSVSPSAQSTLPANPSISALVADNYRLASVKMEYKKAGDTSEWVLIGKKDLSDYSQVVSLKWNTEGLSEGRYLVRITAADAAGLESTPKEITYFLNLLPPSAPTLTGVAGGWKAELTWTSGNETDLAGFRVYRSSTSGSGYKLVKETTGTVFSDSPLTPGHSYYYVVEAVDSYGNMSGSSEVAVIPTNEDVYPPLAQAGKDQQAAVGIAVWFDATLSSDNDRIASFLWDFGDGSTSSESQPSHIYSTPGEYDVTLSVEDPAGNKSSDTLKVTVAPPLQVGNLEVRVIDDSSGAPVSGASIVVQYQDGTSQDALTNGQGIANLVGKPGDYKVFAYKTDYKPSAVDVKLQHNQKTTATLRIKSGQLVVGELNVRRLTLDEIKDAGIDEKAPENQWVYKFEVHLAFNNIPLPPASIIVNGPGQIIGDTFKPIIIRDIPTQGGSSSGTLIAYPVAIPHANHPEVRPTVAYMVIPGEARFLKEFFEIGLSLENTADPQFVIENSKALLKLPQGLSLAPTRERQALEVEIGSFKGGENKQVKWIIRGDEKGEYNLEADFSGILQPFGDPVKATFKTKEPFRVWGDDVLRMHIISQDRADVGHPYYVRLELENVSDIPVYYPAIELVENGKQNYFYAPNQNLEKTVEELPAGQKLVKEYTLVSAIDGELDLSKSYVLKTGGNGTIQSDIQKISVPQNNKGNAPVLKEVQNSDGTVTLTWGAIHNALGYKIYSVRKDLIMSVDPGQLIKQVDAYVNTYTIDEGGIEKDYIITTLLPEGEIMRHAIKWPYGVDPAPAVVTVDPVQVYTKTETEILITANQNGYPVKDGTVDVVDYSNGTVLDSNGQARVKINPNVPGDIIINIYNKDHQWLVSTKITALDKQVQLPAKGFIDTPKKDQVLAADKCTISGWFLDPSGVSKIEVLIDDVVAGEATYGHSRPDVMNVFPAYNNNNSGYRYVLDLKGIPQGSHTIKIRGTGNDGRQTTLPVRTFIRQLTAKGVLDGVKNNQTLSGKHNVRGWVLDSSGVSKIEVLVDGVVVGEAVYGGSRPDVEKVYPEYNNENSGFSFILDTMALSEGTHRITIREIGNNGSQLVLPECTVNVSHKLQTRGHLDVPKDNMTIGGRYCVMGWFLDTSSVSKIEVLVDDAVAGEAKYGYSRPDVSTVYPDYKNANSGYVYLLDTTQLSEGVHTITVRETGMDGNETTLKPHTFIVSRTYQLLPIGYIDVPTSDKTLSGEIKVSGWALDKAGVSKIEILIDSQVAGEAVYGDLRKDVMDVYPDYENNNSGFHYTLDTKLLSDGKHVITLRETDVNDTKNDLRSVEINVLNAK
jgi:fibronectin type 3 domain-containing protein